MLTIPDGGFIWMIYSARARKRSFSSTLTDSDLLGSTLDGDPASENAHKFVERLLESSRMSQTELNLIAAQCSSSDDFRRRVEEASLAKADIEAMFAPMPGSNFSPAEAMMSWRFDIDDFERGQDLSRRLEAQIRESHAVDLADPAGVEARRRERSFRWAVEILDSMKAAQDRLAPNDRPAPNPLGPAFRAEVERLAALSVQICRSAPSYDREALEAELSRPQWNGLAAKEAILAALPPGGVNDPQRLIGPVFGMALTGALWQLALFEACCWKPEQLKQPWPELFLVPDSTDGGCWRSGPGWVERLMDLLPQKRRGGDMPGKRKTHSPFLPAAEHLVGAEHSGATKPQTREKELRELAKGKKPLTFAVVERLSKEAERACQAGFSGEDLKAALERVGRLKFSGHIAGALELLQRNAEADAAKHGGTELLDHLHAAWDDFPKLCKAALEFRTAALREIENAPATNAAGA